MWQGQTPLVDFVQGGASPSNRAYLAGRTHYEFRWWYEYSGGKMTDWGAHHNDIAQWGLGMDESGPVSVQGSGTAPSRDPMSYNTHPQFEAVYTYANGANGAEGTRLVCRDGPPQNFPARNERTGQPHDNGILFEGQDGKWIFVSRSTIMANDRRLIDEPLPPNAIRLPVSTEHMRNFMEAVRNRRQPICPVTVGHRSVTVCHLGNIAIRFFQNQRLTWDPREERFTGERSEEANRHLSRQRREGYPLA
jgi:predicted dehydrogenase